MIPNKVDEKKEVSSFDEKFKNLVLKNDVKMPVREKIRAELMKVSNFTEEEVSIMYWSSLYKAYSLIVRYEQQGVEDEFRKLDWFQKAMSDIKKNIETKEKKRFNYSKFIKQKEAVSEAAEAKTIIERTENIELTKTGEEKAEPKKDSTEILTKIQKKEAIAKLKEQKKMLKQQCADKKELFQEIKKYFKIIKRRFKNGEFSIQRLNEFFDKLSLNNIQESLITIRTI